MANVHVDFMNANEVQGDVASTLQSAGRLDIGSLRPWIGKDGRAYITAYKGGDPNSPSSYQAAPINTNATLRPNEWRELDAAVMRAAHDRLGGFQDLISAGLTYNLGNAMGTTVLEHHEVTSDLDADMTMDGVTRSQNNRPNYTAKYLPIPIVHVDYSINARELEASRKLGNPLDTTSAETAARVINEKLESMLFTDTDYTFGGGSIKSYINHSDRNQVTLSENWDAAGKTASEIVSDVLSMKQSSISAKHYGPWMLYVPTAYETVLDDDYNATTPGTTTRERILKIAGIQGVKVIDKLPANNVVLVQMTSDVVRVVRGMDIQNVEWQSQGRFVSNFKVMTIQVPQIRSDANGNCGVVHLAA